MSLSSLFFVVFIGGFLYANAAFEIPQGICRLNLPAYTGGWYELATSDFIGKTTEADCMCSTTYYTLNRTNSSILDLTNSCIKSSNDSFSSVTGNVFPPPAESNQPEGNLHVVLSNSNASTVQNGNQTANYIIMRLWDGETVGNSQYSLVGGDNANQWWLISRSPNWNETVWQSAQHLLEAYDYNVTDWKKTEQTCLFLGRHGNNLSPPQQT